MIAPAVRTHASPVWHDGVLVSARLRAWSNVLVCKCEGVTSTHMKALTTRFSGKETRLVSYRSRETRALFVSDPDLGLLVGSSTPTNVCAVCAMCVVCARARDMFDSLGVN